MGKVDLSEPDNVFKNTGVVVIGRNEGSRLARSLASVASTNLVVYVDSGSTDDSVGTAKSLGAQVVHLDMSLPFTAARARNAGFSQLKKQHAELEFVQFLDGDCELVGQWIPNGLAFLTTHREVAAVCGRRKERFPDASIYNSMCDYEWNTPIGLAKSCGGESLIRAEVFDRVGGFRPEQIAHEEPELCGRLREAGFQVWRLDYPMSIHDAAIFKLRQFYTRNRRAGFGITQYLLTTKVSVEKDGGDIIMRALCWTLGPPLLVGFGLMLAGWSGIIGILLYPAYVVRQTLRNSQSRGSLLVSVKIAMLSLVAKFAEAHGSIEYRIKSIFRRELKPIRYK